MERNSRSTVASLNSPTIPHSVLSKLAKHPLTDIGLERFLADWKKVPQ